MAGLETLSDEELRAKLAEYGHPVGPITETTKKILLKKLQQYVNEKKSRRSRKSVFNCSSAEESETEEYGGNRRRGTPIPISPPASYLSRKKSPPSRSSINASTSNYFVTPSASRAPSRRREILRSQSKTSPYDFDSGSDSDISNAIHSETILRSCRASKPLTTPRSSVASTVVPNSRKENKPFLSNITRRLAIWGNELNPQDIKETDVDYGPASPPAVPPPYTYRVPPSVARSPHYDRQPVIKGGWRTQLVEKGPMLLLSLFLVFFLWVAATYCLRVYQQRPLLTGKSDNVYPLCTGQNKEGCITSEELPFTVTLYKYVHQVLLSRAVQSICGPTSEDGSHVLPYLTNRQIIQLLIKARPSDVGRIESGVRNLGLLLLANPHWGITILRGDVNLPATATCRLDEASKAVPSDLEGGVGLKYLTPCPEISWGCRLRLFFYGLAYYLVAVLSALVIGYGLVYIIKYYVNSMKKEEEQVMRLVERILSEVTEVCDRNQQEFVAVRHVHDALIPPAHRTAMASLWQKAVAFIGNNESRVRREIQTVWGEQTEVWRPLTASSPTTPATNLPSPDNHLYPDLSALSHQGSRRVWQGEAFETSDGSINALPVAPTQCLKIRHMFQENRDYGANWEVAVRDAIIEKCEGVEIVHIAVDTQSKEGCVFVKCMSLADAGLAFRRLHGCWFDGALVTARYLRLERYYERFPESVNFKVPLKPSNNLKLSLGGVA